VRRHHEGRRCEVGVERAAVRQLRVSLTAELKSNNASEGGITLGAKNLHELIANAPGDEIALKTWP